jgi:hypothetical protein
MARLAPGQSVIYEAEVTAFALSSPPREA